MKRIDVQSLVRRRNQYGKLIRKQYENGNPDGVRMKDIRDWTSKTDGVANCVTTAMIDNMVVELYECGEEYSTETEE